MGETFAEEGALAAAAAAGAKLELTDLERKLLAHLAGAELPLDELIRRTGLLAHQVTAAMTTLAIKGLIAQRPGGVFTARSGPPAKQGLD